MDAGTRLEAGCRRVILRAGDPLPQRLRGSIRVFAIGGERLPHSLFQTGQGEVSVRVAAVAPAVAAIDVAARVHEEAGPREVVVEVELVQVDASHVRYP